MISECKIDIFVSGNIDEVTRIVEENENIKKLQEREPQYIINRIEKKEETQEKEVIEQMDVTQGKVVIGLDLRLDDEKQMYDAVVYNAILGGSAN